MKNVLVLGAGRSATSLISYLLEQQGINLTIAEKDVALAQQKFPEATSVYFDIDDAALAESVIQKSDLVISMLPAFLHIKVAHICLKYTINMLTASYVTDEIQQLDQAFKEKNIACIMELGLDPGIDHMSAMEVLDQIKEKGCELTSFETFTGGLLADNKEKDNPWEYKFTWNPRNVVMAGNSAVKFIQEGRFKYIPYHRLFKRTEIIHIPGYGYFEGYANRDSLKYLDLYNLQGIRTLYRGTLRRPGYCKAWDIFVQLGATDDSYKMEKTSEMTHRQFINSFLQFNPYDSVELKLAHYMNIGLESDEMYKLKWLGMFDDEPVGLNEGTPAQVLEQILKKKWTLDETDRDMIVMWHKFDFIENGRQKQIQAHMVVEGEDTVQTAMAKTVGLPLGIAASKILSGEIAIKGVAIPTQKEIYSAILPELSKMGFQFAVRETIS